MSQPILPVMQCCDVGRKFVVLLHHDETEQGFANRSPEQVVEFYRKNPPDWVIQLTQIEGIRHAESLILKIARCPGCGTAAPSIQLRADPPIIRTILDGGYYCSTCEERLMGCECAPSACLWEPVPKEKDNE